MDNSTSRVTTGHTVSQFSKSLYTVQPVLQLKDGSLLHSKLCRLSQACLMLGGWWHWKKDTPHGVTSFTLLSFQHLLADMTSSTLASEPFFFLLFFPCLFWVLFVCFKAHFDFMLLQGFDGNHKIYARAIMLSQYRKRLYCPCSCH